MTLTTNIGKFKKTYFFPILLLHLVLLINTKFTLWPEMVVYPYLLNNGFILYKDLINPYLPTLSYILSLFTKYYGYSPENFRLLTWAYILFTDILIFRISLLLSKNYYKSTLSLLFFALLSLSFYINGLWFDLIQTPLIILSIYNLYKFIDTKNKVSVQLAFFFALVAFFIKQQAVWLIVFYIAVLIWRYKGKSLFWAKAIGPVLIIFIGLYFYFAIIFTRLNALSDFFFWTTYFPFFKASSLPGYLLLPTIKQALVVFFLFALFISAVGKNLKHNIFILGAFSTALFAYPRFDYFHLVPSLAILSLVAGEALILQAKSKIYLAFILLPSLVIFIIFSYKYFISNWTSEIRFFEADIQSSATFLSLMTDPKDLIYIQNGPDQILPMAKRLPPKPWAIQFPWYLELKGYQQKVVDGISNSGTKYIVFKQYENKKEFDLGAYRPVLIANYINANYHDHTKISDSLWLKAKN